MKVAQLKISSPTTTSRVPFFKKESPDKSIAEKKPLFFNYNSIQPKLTIGQPNDPYEKEADAMADQVVQRLDEKEIVQTKPLDLSNSITPLIQPKCEGCEKEEKLQKKEEDKDELKDNIQRKPIFESGEPPHEDEIQRKCTGCEEEEKVQRIVSVDIGSPDGKYEQEADDVASVLVGISPATAEAKLNEKKIQKKESNSDTEFGNANLNSSSLTSGGSPLTAGLQTFFGNRMGYDFSEVRVHEGSDSIRKNEAVQAHAFTYGNHIWLGENQQATPSFLMAHEMAHVVQQNPKSLSRKEKKSNINLSNLSPFIQRFIFWDELQGRGKPRSGKSIEGEFNTTIPGKDIRTQAPIPNADRTGSGVGRKGLADFYKASSKIGVYFTLPQQGAICGTDNLVTPASLKGATKDGNPRFAEGKIVGISDAPSDITLGEFKPASEELVDFGKEQLNNYEKGIKYASGQVNCWSNHNPNTSGKSDQWTFKKPERFNDSTLPIDPAYKYNPASPSADLSLGIVDFVGENNEMLPVKFNPQKQLGRPVRGGLYFMHAGEGVIVYFFRPADLPGLISGLGIDPKSKEVQAYIEYATFLQNQVIAPLLTAPKKTTPKKKTENKPNHSPNKKTPDFSIQRASKKPIKLKDNFALGVWRGNHNKHQKNFKSKKTDTRDKLEFTELLYKSEDNLKQAGAPSPAKPLPAKGTFDFELGKKTSTDPSKTQNLTTLFGWMELWAGEPVDYLGRFRERFGETFVKIANKFNRLKKKLTDKFKGAHKKHSPTGKSYGIIAVRAFWAALLRASGGVFDNTIDLLSLSLESGLKNKMNEIIPIQGEEFTKMVEENFPQLKEILKTVEDLDKGFDARVEEVVKQFESEIEAIKAVADEAEKYGNLIKLAMVAIQCGTPPGWGCLKLLASRLIAELVDEIMKWCATQQEFNDLVRATGVMDNLPKTLATYAADGIEGILPKIAPIFDRTIFNTTQFPLADKIPCDKGVTDQHKAYAELDEELRNTLGEEGHFLFIMAVEKYGVKSDTEFSASEIREMKNTIPKDVNAEDLRRFLSSDFKPGEGGDVFNTAEFLSAVRNSRLPDNYEWFYVAHPPAKGHTKGETVDVTVTISLYQWAPQWSPVKKIIVPAKVLRRISTKENGLKIYYLPLHDVRFDFFSNTLIIEAIKEFYGFRPDLFRGD